MRAIQQDVENRWESTRAAAASYLDSKDDNNKDDEENRSDIFAEKFENCEEINEALRGLTWKKSKKKGKKKERVSWRNIF